MTELRRVVAVSGASRSDGSVRARQEFQHLHRNSSLKYLQQHFPRQKTFEQHNILRSLIFLAVAPRASRVLLNERSALHYYLLIIVFPLEIASKRARIQHHPATMQPHRSPEIIRYGHGIEPRASDWLRIYL